MDSQSANQLLAHWLCHQAWILRKDPLLCCCLCCSRCCICVCVCEEAWWNEMPGLGYLQGEPLHPITWASQQHSGIGEKLHPSSDGPPEDQAWSNGRGDFFFKSFFSAVERRDCCHPPHPSFFFNLGPPPSSSAYTLFVFYPLVLLEALTGISNLHVWQFVPAWIWRLGGGECLDGCVCESAFVLSAVCFLMEVAHCTHTHIYTHIWGLRWVSQRYSVAWSWVMLD